MIIVLQVFILINSKKCPNMRAYQIEVIDDTLYIYDESRILAKKKFLYQDTGDWINEVIKNDNL